MEKQQEKIRSWGGELNVPINKKDPKELDKGKRKRNFQSAHLKAYLAGHKLFTFGRDFHGLPVRFPVIERWT
jgi:hypothetical protein